MENKLPEISAEELAAYLDGNVSPADASRITAIVKNSPSLASNLSDCLDVSDVVTDGEVFDLIDDVDLDSIELPEIPSSDILFDDVATLDAVDGIADTNDLLDLDDIAVDLPELDAIADVEIPEIDGVDISELDDATGGVISDVIDSIIDIIS